MKRFFNTTLGLSMLEDGDFQVKTLSQEEVVEWLKVGDFENVANPTHANSLDAISRKIDFDLREAQGGRINLKPGDQCLVAQISGIPRETREFTDEEIAKAEFSFRLVIVKDDDQLKEIVAGLKEGMNNLGYNTSDVPGAWCSDMDSLIERLKKSL